MKKVFTLLIMFFLASLANAQYYWSINFEDSTFIERLFIDTNSNPLNIWQIGKPDKVIFDEAYSIPRAIVTDTISSYPVNDTSSFIITHIAGNGFALHCCAASLNGYYWVNSDTLTDYGKIEFSPDHGMTWVDLINDTAYSSYIDWYYKATLTGNSNGWQYFAVSIPELGEVFNIQYDDTILYRFTFISDSIHTNKEGLVFDNFQFEDYAEGIEESQFDFIYSKIFPNPSSGIVNISFENKNHVPFDLFIYDNLGRIVLQYKQFESNFFEFNMRNLSIGNYYYKLRSPEGKFSTGKFVLE